MIITIKQGATILFCGSLDEKIIDSIVKYAYSRRDQVDNFEETIQKVGDYFGLRKQDIMERRRYHEIIQPRAIIYYRLYYDLGYSKTEIARLFGRTHATIINGIKVTRRDYKNAYKNIFGTEIK